MDARELASALFRILETGDPRLATEVVAEDNRNREAAVSPPACAIPGPAGTLASSAWMRSALSGIASTSANRSAAAFRRNEPPALSK